MIILPCFSKYLPKNKLFTMKIDHRSLRPEITTFETINQMRPSWCLYLHSFRNESGMKKTFAFCNFGWAIFSILLKTAHWCTASIYKKIAPGWMSQALPELAQTSSALNQVENLQSEKNPAATQENSIKSEAEKNCANGLEQHHSRVP